MTQAAHGSAFVYLANLRRIVVFTSQLMSLVLSCVDNCRSSFTGVAQLLADVTSHQGYVWKRPVLTTAYVVYALSLFLPEETFCLLAWPSDVLNRTALDSFLLGMRKQFADLLAKRWGVDHRCQLCADGYLLGVDGKHGARRFTCAWKDVGVEGISALGGVKIRKACLNRNVLGSIFCAEHAASKSARGESAIEVEEKEAAIKREGVASPKRYIQRETVDARRS